MEDHRDKLSVDEGLLWLCRSDQVIAYLASKYGTPTLSRASLSDFGYDPGPQGLSLEQHFYGDLVDIVIHQQLAGKAAEAISSRVREVAGGILSPDAIAWHNKGPPGAVPTSIHRCGRLKSNDKS